MTARHHAIVGDGASAAALAETLQLAPGDRLTLIGPQVAELGRGLAYADHPERPWRLAYLLNSPAAAVLPEFGDWLGRHWADVSRQMEGRRPDWLGFGAEAIAAQDWGALFAPRAFFGTYLRELVETALDRHSRQGITVTRRATRCTHIARTGSGFLLRLADKTTLDVDSVDIAPGAPAMTGFGGDAGPHAFPALYGNEEAIAGRLRPGRTVLCLGANATMLDLLRFLQSVLREQDISLHVLSPRARLPEPLVWTRPRRAPVTPALIGPFATAREFLAAIDAEIAGFRRDGATMAELRAGYRLFFRQDRLAGLLPDLAERQGLTGRLERRFRRGTHDSLADFARLARTGRITHQAARVQRVIATPGGCSVTASRPDGSILRLTAPLVVNCTGAGREPVFDPVTRSLIDQGWIGRSAVDGGLSVGAALTTQAPGLRYLSPALTRIGTRVPAFPLYDLGALRIEASAANSEAPR